MEFVFVLLTLLCKMEAAYKITLLPEVEMQDSVGMAFCSLERNAMIVTYRIGMGVLQAVKLRLVTFVTMTILF